MRTPNGALMAVVAMAVLRATPAAALTVRVEASYTGSTSADTAETTVPVPDIGGAVGPEHFVELLNGRWAVYDKETGVPVASSFARLNCASMNPSWSRSADRWFEIDPDTNAVGQQGAVRLRPRGSRSCSWARYSRGSRGSEARSASTLSRCR